MSDETVTSPAGTEGEAKRSGSRFGRLLWIVIIIVVIAAGGYFLMSKTSSAVAVVNGEKISLSEYNKHYAQLVASVTSQGGSATTTEVKIAIKNQVLQDLISETLLLQAAEKESIKVSSDAVEAQFSQNRANFAAAGAFDKALTDQGYTEKTFKDSLTRLNIIQQYLAKHVNLSSVTATDVEVKALYDQAVARDKTIPPLAQVRTQVENQIKQQKQAQLISNYIEQLRASGKVEILLK